MVAHRTRTHTHLRTYELRLSAVVRSTFLFSRLVGLFLSDISGAFDRVWTLARECLAGPSTAQTQRLTDTQSALRRFPQHRTQGFATDLECKCIRGAKIPHAVCENTTRGGPRKSPLSKECAKKCPAWRQGLVKIPHGGHLSRGKANDSGIGRKMSELVPRLGENLRWAGRQPSGKQL